MSESQDEAELCDKCPLPDCIDTSVRCLINGAKNKKKNAARCEYQRRPEVKARRREYTDKPEVKAMHREYSRQWRADRAKQ